MDIDSIIINFSKETLIEALEYCKFNPKSQILVACRLLDDVRIITRWIYENIPLQENYVQDFCAYENDMDGSVKTEIAFYSGSKIIIKTINKECLGLCKEFNYIIAEDQVIDIINSMYSLDDLIDISDNEVLNILGAI